MRTLSESFAAPDSVPKTAGSGQPFRVTFMIVPRFNLIEIVAMIEPMRVANYLSPTPIYEWEIVSFEGPRITASNGFSIDAGPPAERIRRGELIFVCASWGAENYNNREAISWIRRQWRDGARIATIELGCYIAARAGLLKGRSIATHFSWAPAFQEDFPDVQTVDQLFTIDPQIITCAGALASVDLMLRLIRDQHGEGLAAEVSDQMLSNAARPATTPQRRGLGNGIENLPSIVRRTITLIEKHMFEPLNVPAIAEEVGLSQRQLERLFKASVGCTIVQFGLLVRLQHARVLLVATRQSVRDIATASGFNTLSHFAHAFRRCFGRRPSEYRQAWPQQDAAPSWPGTLNTYLEALQRRTARSVRREEGEL